MRLSSPKQLLKQMSGISGRWFWKSNVILLSCWIKVRKILRWALFGKTISLFGKITLLGKTIKWYGKNCTAVCVFTVNMKHNINQSNCLHIFSRDLIG